MNAIPLNICMNSETAIVTTAYAGRLTVMVDELRPLIGAQNVQKFVVSNSKHAIILHLVEHALGNVLKCVWDREH